MPLRVRRPLGRGAYEPCPPCGAGPGRYGRPRRAAAPRRAGPRVRRLVLRGDRSREHGAARAARRRPRRAVGTAHGRRRRLRLGLLLARLARAGVGVQGVEGSRAALRRVRPSIPVVRANLERGVPGDRHLRSLPLSRGRGAPATAQRPAARDGPVRAQRHRSCFTAAQPGQPGTSHLNTSPTQYWRSLVAEAGLTSGAREGELASAIADVPEPAYSTRTSWSSSVPLDSRIRK